MSPGKTKSATMQPPTSRRLWRALHYQGWLAHHEPVGTIMRHYAAMEREVRRLRKERGRPARSSES